MSMVMDSPVLMVSPEMVRVNGSRDSDWMAAIWELVRHEAAAGRSVQVVPTQVTYSPAEVARMVGVSKATVIRRIEDGTVKASRRGSHYRVPESEVYAYSHVLADQLAELVADDLDF
ncbi:MAG: helix-turn-helix domain-containing protein [Propionibacteriaceae bacterium]|jgi:excisionase family DNA binding protein|nr:helix-turn-helix domain-containing protein [Propionibacteriaceae bacterium]